MHSPVAIGGKVLRFSEGVIEDARRTRVAGKEFLDPQWCVRCGMSGASHQGDKDGQESAGEEGHLA